MCSHTRCVRTHMGTGMVLAAHKLVHWNCVRCENAGKNGFAREDETELYSWVVVTFSVKVMRCNNVTRVFLAAGITTAARRLLGRRARFPSSGICVIGQTHNLLEPDNTCSRGFSNTSNVTDSWGQYGISDSKQ